MSLLFAEYWQRIYKVGHFETSLMEDVALCPQLSTMPRWVMVLSQHVELYWLFNLEIIKQSVTSPLLNPLPNSVLNTCMHGAKQSFSPLCTVKTGQFAVREFKYTYCTSTHTHTDKASIPQSFPNCCYNEKFTQKWSHWLFWAHLWPKNVLKR